VRILLFVASLAIFDLIIKIWTVRTLGFQNKLKLIGDLVWIIPIRNVGTSGKTLFATDGILILLQLLFLFVFYRIQTQGVAKGFKWASSLIVFGWIGNWADHFIFSDEAYPAQFTHMDYFYDGVLTNSVTSITQIMILGGWLLLLIMIIVRFRDVRKIFSNATSK
jgi:lipoprotein signal peptidase